MGLIIVGNMKSVKKEGLGHQEFRGMWDAKERVGKVGGS